VSKKELLELLCKSKALILPSSYEALPYTCLEAMACGTPVVVSSAIPEEVVIDGFNGIRVNSFNPVDYASDTGKTLSKQRVMVKPLKKRLGFREEI